MYKRRTRNMFDCGLKWKINTVWLLKQPQKFPHYTLCLINQAFLMFLVTYIMYNCYFSWFGDRSTFMNRQSYLLFCLSLTLMDLFRSDVKIFIQIFNTIMQLHYAIWSYKFKIICVKNDQAAVLYIQHFATICYKLFIFIGKRRIAFH